MDMNRLLAVARGEQPADLLLVNGLVVNTFTAEIEHTSVAIAEGKIAGLGDYREATQVIDLNGRYLAPGLIDGHLHVESTYLTPEEYARAVVPRGVLGAVADPHEAANVRGIAGIHYMLEGARRVPMELRFMASSCVPATHLETSGADLEAHEIKQVLGWEGVMGLAEMMNFPGVIFGDPATLAKLEVAAGRVKDGHAPGVTGKQLNAYLCPLIGSDHETTAHDEGLEKLRRGMRLMIREGSSEKNLAALLPLVNDGNYHRCMLVVDDRSALDLLNDGEVDAVVRKAIALGCDPIRALQMATLTAAEYFRLEGLGGIAPGYWANCFVFSDLHEMHADEVFYRGKLVAQGGKAHFQPSVRHAPQFLQTMNVRPYTCEDLALPAVASSTFPVIEIVPNQIITRRADETPPVLNGAIVTDVSRDLLKLVVIERHRATGNIGRGLVRGYTLQRGALATTVAHDSHNIVVVGVDDRSIYTAAKAVENTEGGLAVADGDTVLGMLPLPVMGLMSLEPLESVAQELAKLDALASGLGCTLAAPFATLSFLALPVIPEIKLTDLGLVDAAKVEMIPV